MSEKLTPLLRLRYHDSIADAVADLGRADEIRGFFSGFQQYLYQQQPSVWPLPAHPGGPPPRPTAGP